MRNRIKYALLTFVITFALALVQCTQKETNITWQSEFDIALQEGGHRNWFVVVDAAYPKQSAAGINTIATGEDHLEALKYV